MDGADVVKQQLYISPRVDPFTRAPFSCEIAYEVQTEVRFTKIIKILHT